MAMMVVIDSFGMMRDGGYGINEGDSSNNHSDNDGGGCGVLT